MYMQDTDSQFKSLVRLVKEKGPEGYTVEDEIEEYHVLFENDTEQTSFNVLLLSTSDNNWVEVDLFKGGKLIDSETFQTEDRFSSFVEQELDERLNNL